MKKRILSMLVILTLVMALAVPASAASAAPASHLYVFGDSSVDIGRAKALTTVIVESGDAPEGAYIKAEEDWYWEGRYSNGKVFTELLAEHLGIGITSYAVGGAKSGPDATGNTNWSSWLPGTGGIEQTKEFIKDRGGSVDPNGLYLISTGGNDSYNLATDTVENVTAQSAAYIKEMVEDLSKAGAQRFVVMLQFAKPEKELSEFAAAHQSATRKAMSEAASEYGVEILCIDLTPLTKDMTENMDKYGYKTFSYYIISDFVPYYGYAYHRDDNTEQFKDAPAEYFGVYEYDGFTGEDEDGVFTIDEHYYYDEYHVTANTHKNIFTYIQPMVDAFISHPVDNMTDVNVGDWYYDAAVSVIDNGLFIGTSETSFSPDETMEFGMFALVLSRIANADLSSYNATEVYAPAISWAKDNGIIASDSLISSEPISREMMADALVKLAQHQGIDLAASSGTDISFNDEGDISSEYKDSIMVAAGCNLIIGDANLNFNPKDSMTRAHAATVFSRYLSFIPA